MEWLIGIVVVGFLFYRFVVVKSGNLKFWKVVQANPEEAYAFFKCNPCFVIFESEPPGGYRANLPAGDWVGPFKLPVPSQNRTVTIFGRSSELEAVQEQFIESIHG